MIKYFDIKLGIVLAVFTLIATWYVLSPSAMDTDVLMKVPVETWSTHDVLKWCHLYAHVAVENGIDGKRLLEEDESELISVLNITDNLHVDAFHKAITDLKRDRVKTARNLWQAVAMYPAMCAVLSTVLPMTPRATIFSLWLVYPDDIYYPALKVIRGVNDQENVSNETPEALSQSSPTWYPGPYLTALLYLMPEYFAISYALSWTEGFVTSVCIIMITVDSITHSCREFRTLTYEPKRSPLIFNTGYALVTQLVFAIALAIFRYLPTPVNYLVFIYNLYTFSALHVSRIAMSVTSGFISGYSGGNK